MDDKFLIQSFLYGINQLATKQLTPIDAGKDVLISSMKVLDVGKEVVVPKLFNKAASSCYDISNHRMINNFPLLCEVLTAYLRKKKELTAQDRVKREELFKYQRNGSSTLPLQFHDFFIVEQAYMFSSAYLDSSDEYVYEYDGLVELSALVAIYLFKNMTRENEYNYYGICNKMDENPGGLYKFKSETNVVSYINSIVANIDGIDEYEEDEDEDEEE
ncbi:TPA: hypothetical protein QCR36_003856 [Bacillus cereus]|nr:hypothetical protein [Bacillus cereus]HDR4742343.1 hypothetical protein [Bacillus cereus]HDR4747929.1 hypothetical protein [Bacillus cereus]HDR4753404.1 hypothetical protein [Bacillus cereus]HDR4770613.1 hypothetical protein [Bacillus cereus]